MELLPKDIITIVYRYIFNDIYKALKHQYHEEWVIYCPDKCKTFWSERWQIFEDGYNTAANWRPFPLSSWARERGVRPFKKAIMYYSRIPLAKNY